MFLADLAGIVGKLTVDRARPEFVDPSASGVGPSFPSGHALLATVGMGIVVLVSVPVLRGVRCGAVWGAGVLIAFSTAAGRPALGVHWVSDVVAGGLLGVAVLTASLLLWTFLPRKLRERRRVPD